MLLLPIKKVSAKALTCSLCKAYYDAMMVAAFGA
jgi:hypothetical protein